MLCNRNMPGFWICQGYTTFLDVCEYALGVTTILG